MYKYSLSIRAYTIGRKYGLPCVDEWARCIERLSLMCRSAALDVVDKRRGMKTAVELFRAAGMGVYAIYNAINQQIELDRVKTLCDYYDYTLHEPLN